MARATNRFAIAMYAELGAAKGNLAFSPASISLALNMTRAGARGETAAHMAQALRLEDGTTDAAFGSLLAAWNADDKPYELAVANRLFGEKTMRLEEAFLDLTGRAYGAPLQPVDFRGAAEQTRETINEWVADRTEERIVDLLPPGSLDSDTRLVLTNAVYFKGAWKTAFDEDATYDQPFHAPGGDVQTPMMHIEESFAYAETDGLKVVSLPYRGEDLSMTLLVPNEVDGLADLQKKLDADALESWLGAAVKQKVRVALPRFEIDPPQAMKLQPALSALGMADAFTGDADFSGITQEDRLYIDEVFHKAFVKVNEEGTEAAAATAVVMTKESAVIEDTKSVVADRPFIFLIRDEKSGMILFMGRVERP
ncbi:MAG: serpin family protein [Polyangiaceae bacterium]